METLAVVLDGLREIFTLTNQEKFGEAQVKNEELYMYIKKHVPDSYLIDRAIKKLKI